MKKCKCPYAYFSYMGYEEKEIIDCLVYNHEIGEHYDCNCNNNEKSELFYENCCLYKLQSKIDKANKYLEEHTDKLGKIKIPKIDFNYNELSDILKEAKNVKNN